LTKTIQLLALIASVVAPILTVVAAFFAWHAKKGVQEIHVMINSRMSAWLAAAEKAAHAAGVAEALAQGVAVELVAQGVAKDLIVTAKAEALKLLATAVEIKDKEEISGGGSPANDWTARVKFRSKDLPEDSDNEFI
jgi:hypothetical protein